MVSDIDIGKICTLRRRKKKEPYVTDCCSYRQCKQCKLTWNTRSSDRAYLIKYLPWTHKNIDKKLWLAWLWFVALQAWTRNSLNTLFFYFCHELFKTAWICWEKYYFLRGINFHKFSLTWPGILVFFQFEKGQEKTQNKKKQVRFHSHSTCCTAWKCVHS